MPPSRSGPALLGAALAFGVVANVLSRTVPGRLDVALGVGALVLLLCLLVERGLIAPHPGLGHLGIPLAFLTGSLIWRDSAVLFVLNLLGIALLAALASPRVRAVGRSRAGLSDYARGAGQVAGGTAFGAAALLFVETDWQAPPDGGLRQVRGATVGLLAAVPVAVVLGGLLMEADPAFDRIMTQVFAGRLDAGLSNAMTIAVWGWLGAGLLRAVGSGGDARRQDPMPAAGRFGLAEVGIVLLVVDLLFLAFIAVQFRYLFGGAELVRTLTGLTFAEYARSGFFQLVTVVALSLPLLLAAEWSLDKSDPTRVRRFRSLARLMLILLNVLLASALYRMGLYTAEYGLTELRFYTTAFMAWLVLVLAWFGATVLRGSRERFGAGAVTAAYLVLAALNLVNPDGLIARHNLARPGSNRPVDAWYLAHLSADAVPAIRRGARALPETERCHLSAAVNERWAADLAARGRWNIALASVRRLARSATPSGGMALPSCAAIAPG